MGGQLRPAAGSVSVDGINLSTLSRSALYRLRYHMGILFQEGALFTDMNVFDNVAFLLREHTNLPADMIRDLVLMKLEAVGLRGAAFLDISQLSGGMARRVALARAIMLDPSLMLYDEPFTGQDPINCAVLLSLIKRLNTAMHLTSVVVTHDVHLVRQFADYMCVISSGRLMVSGTPDEVFACQQEDVRQFLEGLSDGPVAFQYPAKSIVEDLEL